jgi:hypothetical protein
MEKTMSKIVYLEEMNHAVLRNAMEFFKALLTSKLETYKGPISIGMAFTTEKDSKKIEFTSRKTNFEVISDGTNPADNIGEVTTADTKSESSPVTETISESAQDGSPPQG